MRRKNRTPFIRATHEGIATSVSVIPATTARPRRWPDWLLAILVLSFAFLSASFPARNSDLWMHLATGRLMAAGDYQFGVDPFGYTTEGKYWANHSWLADLILYQVYALFDGRALVIGKAIGVLLLAMLMLRASRTEGPFWSGAGCILLAVVAMTPRLLLQPACASYLLLGTCLVLLRKGGRSWYLLPAVVGLWVNLDAWFLLGPLTIVLYMLGQRLSPSTAETPRLPLWLPLACCGACLLSPHHVHALVLPAELSPSVWESEIRHDSRFAALFASPWSTLRPGNTGAINIALWAYFAILGLSVFSFIINRAAFFSWRLPVFVFFALLGTWQTRLVPFFAVVAGPIAALNLRERLAAGRFSSIVGRTTIVLVSLTLIALTWPGWLQGFDRRDRPLGWSVEADPTLRHSCVTLLHWRAKGVLKTGSRIFATNPDAAHHLVWFCPGEKIFLDSRLSLFTSVVSDFECVCESLAPTLSSGQSSRNVEATQVLERYRIGCALYSDGDMSRIAACLREIAVAPERWRLLAVSGQAIIVERPDAPADPASFDPERSAYGPIDDDGLPSAEKDGPGELARPMSHWELYLKRPGGTTWHAGAARVYLQIFEEDAVRQLAEQRQQSLSRYAAGLAGLPGNFPRAGLPYILTTILSQDSVFLPDLYERPAALPLLAVRAARRALSAHPQDAEAWLTLAQAYVSLGRTTAEAVGATTLRPLGRLRRIQTVASLNQAVARRPDLTAAHEALARLHAEAGHFDIALKHRERQMRLVRERGRLRGEEESLFAERLSRLDKAVGEMRDLVQDAQNRFAVRSYRLTGEPLARARLALQLGLAETAVDDVLLRTHSDLYGVEGLRLLIELLLEMGRVQEVRDLLDRNELKQNPSGLGYHNLSGPDSGGPRWTYRFPAYDWFDLCEAAAAGGYARAADAAGRLRARLRAESVRGFERLRPVLAVHIASDICFAHMPASTLARLIVQQQRDQIASLVIQVEFMTVEQADLQTVEAMLLLECGQSAAAADRFREALELYGAAQATAPALPGRPLATSYRRRIALFQGGR